MGSDEQIAGSIQAHLGELEGVADQAHDADGFLFDNLTIALTDVFFAAMSLFLLAVERGERKLLDRAIGQLQDSLSILRIPMKAATDSDGKRPPVPIQNGHFGRGSNWAS